MIRCFSTVVAIALLVLASGCSTNSDLSGVRIPNSRPDTRITGQPPTLLEAGFTVDLNWTGSDPDGNIVGYEWKISNNGTDGISPRDTLTTDPLTGAVLHPWHFTSANDTTFLVLADQQDFPGDEHSEPRSFRSHSVFIRAVDDKGAVDPSPAYISFTSTTIVPTCKVEYPNLGNLGFKTVPGSVTIGWSGVDSDFELNVPTQVRFLWISAQYGVSETGEPRYVRTPFEYAAHPEVIDFDDPDWSPWRGYDPQQDNRKVQFPDQPNGEYFLFAVQVRDTAGAVSVGLDYQVEVANLWIKTSGFAPQVNLAEPFLGIANSSEMFTEIAGGQPLNFIWTASSEAYNGEIVSFRHGWDIIDPNDPNDPGWAIPPGLTPQNIFAVERSFQDGLHAFYLRVLDDSGQSRLITWRLQVIPFVSLDNQQPLLVIDQVVDPDAGTFNWPDQNGSPRNAERYRNAYWHFLAEGSGGVGGFTWGSDWRNNTDDVNYADLVKYKAVLCYAESKGEGQIMFQKFRPRNGIDQFVWLAPYQERGGNFFLVGAGSMESFLEGLPNYMVPIIFDSRQPIYVIDPNVYITGFGTVERPDGTRVQRGPKMYPYATAGITALDWTSTATKYIYSRPSSVRFDRTSNCVGLKGIVLDPEFKANHGIGPGVVADTMFTSNIIDWQDVVGRRDGTLALLDETYQFPFRTDEFYNTNVSSRSDPVILQECDVPESPDGMCIQPMFRGISRMDWLREIRWNDPENPEPDWPLSRYTEAELDEDTSGCGSLALTSYEGQSRSSSRLNGLNYGFMSYKMIRDKPVRKADVYWGFDPYRFDEDDSRKAIRWVLDYFGLPINP